MAVAANREDLNRPLAVSGTAHGVLLALLLMAAPSDYRGEPWGGVGGGSVQVSVVRSLPGVPLPRPAVVTQSRVASQAPGLHRAPVERSETQQQAATQLPRFGEDSQRQTTRTSRQEQAAPLPPGAIPSEGGGPPALPYTTFQVGGGAGGLALGAGGAFGNRYPWYVESVRRRISSNWLLSTVDPYVQWAPRAVITFEIMRDGTVLNIQMLQSSGVPSVDRSALRAIRDSSPLDRLPSDYRGSKVAVEFWFDFRRP